MDRLCRATRPSTAGRNRQASYPREQRTPDG
jgi:hypothetical protein